MKAPNNHPVNAQRLSLEPLTKKNWDKLEQLFGDKGACGNCWCMYYRLKKKAFDEGKSGGRNKTLLQQLVWKHQPTGLLGIYEGNAVAWCAFAPREDFIKLENSRVHKRIDDAAVWSIPCFYIDKKFRKKGFTFELLKAVINHAKRKGIKVIEAYPVIPTTGKLPDAFAWNGLYQSFERAGFEIVDQASKNRPMVRYYLP